MAWREPCREWHARSAPSDFSNCSSRLDRSVASIPEPGRKHSKSDQLEFPQHHSDALHPHSLPASASLDGWGGKAVTEPAAAVSPRRTGAASSAVPEEVVSGQPAQTIHCRQHPSRVLGRNCKPVGIALPPSPPEVPGTGPATQAAGSTAALLAADAQPSVLQPSHSPISLMKACTMALLLSLGWAGLRSGWCLHGRTLGALVGRLLSRPALRGGATAWEVDFWPGTSGPAAALGSNGAFSAASFPGSTAFSVAWVPGDSPTGAGDTSAGQQMAAGGTFGSWLGVAAWDSSRGWVGTACGTGTAGGTLLGWAVAAEGPGRG